MKIFISYRRGDAVAIAGRLYDRLSDRYGADAVFMDFASIPVGNDFTLTITERAAKSDVLLALIGPKWQQLGNVQRDGPDFAVLEIAAALEHGVRVVPILLGDAQMPPPADMPERIRMLSSLNALRLEPGERFNSDVERLTNGLPGPQREAKSLLHRVKKWFRS